MAWVVPTTRATGYVVDAAEWNKNTVDNPIALKALVDAAGVAGTTTQVQFNDAGAFAGDAGLTYNKTTDALTLAGQLIISGAAAGQIVFPGTQNASTNVNTLDDYEEGTWTPTIGGSGGQSGQAYTTQVGTYTKIGKQVTASFNIVLSTLGVVTTNVQVQGLPFTSQNTANAVWSCTIGQWANTNTTLSFLTGVLANNATAITLKHVAGAATATIFNLVQADFTNTTQISGSITYMASA